MELNNYSKIPRLSKEDEIELNKRPSISFTRQGCDEGYFKLTNKNEDGSILIEILADKDFLLKV